MGDLFSNMSGLAYKKNALAIKAGKMIRVLRGGNIAEEQFRFKSDDVFISDEFIKPELYLRKNYMITPAVSSLDHIGKIALIDKDYSDTVVGGFVLMLIPHFNDDVVSQYLLYAFAAKHHRDNCRNITHKSGQAFYNLSREQMMNLPVPIPPREEMERITAMLKRVLPKAADYAVVDTALQNLNGNFPEALKKSILQEAVQGKLVPQDPSDEPAEALLERIRAEKQRLIKEKKIKKDKHESVIFRRDNSHYEKRGSEEVCIDDEIPFEIPENWAWTRLISVCTSIADGDHQPPPQVLEGIPFLVISNVSTGNLDFSNTRYVPHPYFDSLADERTPTQGNLLFTVTGSYGIVVPVDTEKKFCFQRHIALLKFNGLPTEFMRLWLSSTLVYAQCQKAATGTAQKTVGLTSLKTILIPVPPVNEQVRIVKKLKTLLNLAAL